MINHNLQAIILAAGKSKRFKTLTSKLVEKLCGKEMILHITSALQSLGIEMTMVVGHQKELVQETVVKHHGNSIKFITQDKQEGTGHAVLCSKPTWHKHQILVMNGDMPLVNSQLIELLYQRHQETNAAMTLAMAYDIDPSGAYGRIIQRCSSISIIEAKEFTYKIEDYPFINAGIYLFDRSFLASAIEKVQRNSVSNEFYITDLVKIASDQQKIITTVPVELDKVRGINTIKELWQAEQVLRSEIIISWMNKGVRFSMPHTVHVDIDVNIGEGTIIDPCVQLIGATCIGCHCRIGSFSQISDAQLHDHVTVQPHCIINDTIITAQSSVGPFAYISRDSTNDNKISQSPKHLNQKSV